jgi:uncharacterized protein
LSAPGTPRIESLRMAGPAGVLEGVLRLPPDRITAAALLCHPHPLHQGSMHSPVIFRAARAFHRRGYATLRFNFRGVGLSDGRFDGGRGEKDDVRAVLEILAGRLPGMPITLVGYSFGSQVGFEAAGEDSRVDRLVGIGLPVSMAAFDFLKRIPKRLLLIQGSEDEIGPRPAVERLVREIGERARLILIPGADHLFTGQLGRLEESLAAALEEA